MSPEKKARHDLQQYTTPQEAINAQSELCHFFETIGTNEDTALSLRPSWAGAKTNYVVTVNGQKTITMVGRLSEHDMLVQLEEVSHFFGTRDTDSPQVTEFNDKVRQKRELKLAYDLSDGYFGTIMIPSLNKLDRRLQEYPGMNKKGKWYPPYSIEEGQVTLNYPTFKTNQTGKRDIVPRRELKLFNGTIDENGKPGTMEWKDFRLGSVVSVEVRVIPHGNADGK